MDLQTFINDFLVKNEDGTYSRVGDVIVPECVVKDGAFVIAFKEVLGSFDCANLKLNTLAGAPKYVANKFWCMNNELRSLSYAPIYVGGSFNCSNNLFLHSLVGAPKYSGGFYCYNCNLSSLEGAPKYVDGDFNCNNNKLVDLVGASKYVEGNFWCHNNKLVDFLGAPDICNNFYCTMKFDKMPKGVKGKIVCK